MKQIMTLLQILAIVLLSAASVLAQVEKKEIGNLVLEDMPDISAAWDETLDQYQNTRSADVADWTPDGESILIKTRFAETTQFHLIEKPSGARTQITFFDEPVGGGKFCPASNYSGFLFSKDIGGNEFFQLYFFDKNKAKARLMTDGKSRNTGGVWSNLGDRFAYSSTRRNKSDYDIYLRRMDERYPEEMIFEGKGNWTVRSWSPDDSKILLSNFKSINENYLWLLDLKTGSASKIAESEEPAAYEGGEWTADGKGIYLTSDFGSDFKNLKHYDFESGQFTNLTADIRWDVTDLKMSPNRKNLAFVVNENGLSKLYFYNIENKRYVKAPGLPEGIIEGMAWNPDSKRLAISIETATSPADVYVLNTISFSLERWTRSEVGGLDIQKFIQPALIEFETFDKEGSQSRKIPAYYYKPKAIGPHPVLIHIHGGPESQYRPNFNPVFQYFANELGVAVIAPNVRGSAGYGKNYVNLDNGFLRENSVKDIGALIDWIGTQPELDPSRIAVTGGSYGGYMVLSSLVHFGEKLRCGIDVVGISNFVTFLENTQSYRRDLRRAEYGDERDPDMHKHLLEISPNRQAHKIKNPLFVVQGLNDPRVPASEAEQIVGAVRKNGGSVWYLAAKDEGHGFKKKTNRDFYTQSTLQFLKKFLLDEPVKN